MSYSEQLERETENCREQLADTLAELRERLTPGQVVDQLVDYAQDTTGGLFYHNLKRQVADNPIPVAVLGAGLAWLMLSNRKAGMSGPRVSQAVKTARDSVSETADAAADAWRDASSHGKEAGARSFGAVSSAAADAREGFRSGTAKASEAAGEAASRVGETASDAASRLRDKLAETTSRAKGAASAVGDTVSSSYERATLGASRAASAVADSASGVASSATSSGRAFFDFCREQPLVLAGIGVAVGAALGAMLPPSEAEDQLMGEASDELKEKAQHFAGEQVEKAKAVGEHASEGAGREAQRQDLAGEAVGNEAFVGREAGIVPSEGQLQETGNEELETPHGRGR